MTKCAQCDRPASEGGTPVRTDRLLLFDPVIAEQGITAVTSVLRSGWLATGGAVSEFEAAFADYVGVKHAVAVTSGTAALELALQGLGIGAGDEVVTTPLTFVATAHAILHCGAVPVLADIDTEAWTIDPACLEAVVSNRTRCILPVHFAGRPCDMACIGAIAAARGLVVLGDCAHAIEAEFEGRNIGGWGDVNAYSFHPCKTLTTGEGGMVVTEDATLAARVMRLRFHGLTPASPGSDWLRDVAGPGHKANMSNIQAALGLAQLPLLDERRAHRRRLVERYRIGLAGVEAVTLPPSSAARTHHAWHLFNVLLDLARLRIDRTAFIRAMAEEGIEAGVHYRPLNCLSYLQERLGIDAATCPEATGVGRRIVSLPLHVGMEEGDVDDVVAGVCKLVRYYGC